MATYYSIRVKIPELSQERRMEYVKVMKERVENARVSARSVRQKAMKDVDEAVHSGLSEDEGKRVREKIESMVKETNEKIEEIKDLKEKDLMTV